MKSQPKPRFWRTSLRELLALVTVVAVGTAGLMYAGDTPELIASTVVMLALLWAVVASVGYRGRKQAFAIAFLVVTIGYMIAVYSGGRSTQRPSVDEFDPYVGRLPTTWVLQKIHFQIRKVQPPPTKQIAGGFMGGSGVDYGGGLSDGGLTSGIVWNIEHPDRHDFMVVGHALWLLLLGYVAGRAALFLHARREYENTKVESQP